MPNVSPKEASEILGVSNKTLQRWDKMGKIKSVRTEGGHRRYVINIKKDSSKYIYARVSSTKEKEELKKQISTLKDKFPHHTIIKDIGSGLDYDRPGFNKIIDELLDGKVKEVVVLTPDRFVRFGFSMFRTIFKKFKAKLTAVKTTIDKAYEEEISNDLLTIASVFAARKNGNKNENNNENNSENNHINI